MSPARGGGVVGIEPGTLSLTIVCYAVRDSNFPPLSYRCLDTYKPKCRCPNCLQASSECRDDNCHGMIITGIQSPRLYLNIFSPLFFVTLGGKGSHISFHFFLIFMLIYAHKYTFESGGGVLFRHHGIDKCTSSPSPVN